jgi:hypothetical protein
MHGKPVWNSETGASDRGALTGSQSSWRRAGRYVVEWRSGLWLYAAFWENIRQLSANFLTDVGYGISKYMYYDLGNRNIGSGDLLSAQYTGWDYDDSLRVKAAFLGAMSYTFNGSTGVGPLTLSGVSSFLYMRYSTNPVVALWSTTTNKTVTLAGSVTTGEFYLTDMFGNRTVPTSLAVQIDKIPVLLEGIGTVTRSNLTYAVTNASVVERADTAAPVLAILDWPRVVPQQFTTFRWMGIDREGVSSDVLPTNTVYAWRINNGAWSDWIGDTFAMLAPTTLTNFSVAAKDASGNAVTNSITLGEEPAQGTNSITATTLNVQNLIITGP